MRESGVSNFQKNILHETLEWPLIISLIRVHTCICTADTHICVHAVIFTEVAGPAATGEAVDAVDAMHHGRTCDIDAVVYILLAVDPHEPSLARASVVTEVVVARRSVLARVRAAFIQALKHGTSRNSNMVHSGSETWYIEDLKRGAFRL